MATKTRDISPLVKVKRSPNRSKTKSLVVTNAINLIASNRKNIYLKSKVCSSHDKTQGKKPTPSTYPNITYKEALNYGTSIDKPPSSFDYTQVKKNPTLSNDLNIVHNKPKVARGSLIDNRPSTPSSLDNAQVKKLAPSSSSCIPLSIHNKQALARRRLSFDHRPPMSSFRDNSPQIKKLVPKNDPNIHRKQTPTRRRLSIDHKPPLSSPLLKHRTSSNPRERIPKPYLSSSSKNSTSQKPLLNKLFKAPHTSSNKNVIEKQHAAGLYDKAVNINKTITKKQDSAVTITSNLTDIVANIDPHENEELKKEEHQELVIEDHEDLSDTADIDEYLKAVESSSLYGMENQQVINVEIPEEQRLVEETNHKEVEEIKNHEPSDLDLEEKEKQESDNQEEKEKEKGEGSETLSKALDDCQQKKEEGHESNLKIDQEEKEEREARNNKGKEENNNKISTTTMTFAKAYPHLVHKKENVVTNDVIEETTSKLRDQRKNRVKALASAFEAVISLQDPNDFGMFVCAFAKFASHNVFEISNIYFNASNDRLRYGALLWDYATRK
ncbi:hypothetical protein CQW23_18832 [Capsicum baccatum]|uniref:Calmodulin-binding domain-containing protein n=1 Tax=Capsicum baccatum TaxID=33114 RepID=A0A2G2W431_CAPBA|nr:hypothetical protein CQW23_18832 [Capsicum baccatum]